ncbi:MAG: hypothetical protein CHACPFDD_01762 [Phycisphaerae bacterium]|nr:hypothetical protein [Phycisphaerae bacterium]
MAATADVREFPRQYLPASADVTTWDRAEPHYRELSERAIDSADGLDRWLRDWSELDAVFDEEGAARYIQYTCQTDDPQRERRYLDYVEHLKPRREPWLDRLRRRFAEHAVRFPLPPKRYEVLTRKLRNAIELFRVDNVPLLTEDDKLSQQYQKLTAAMTCTYHGQEHTIQQLGRYLEEPDRAVREEAWRLASDRYLADADALNRLYDDMVALRHQVGRNAGFADYREYMFRRLERFDYTPDDCLRFHDAIERVVVPAAAQLAEQRRRKLNVPRLRPWDLDVDPEGRAPLRPFETDQQLSAGCARIFHRVTPEFGRIFDTLRTQQLLDLGSRKGKAPGGYQLTYHERRMPFIFMNAVGTEDDVGTLLHEGGHAFHTWSCRNEPLLPYRTYPMEIAEVASMGMECLAHPHLEEFYGPDAGRARRRHLTDILNFFPWMARVDAFQHYVYTHVSHSVDRRLDEWQTLTRRFAPFVDWSGLESYDRNSWHRKLHFFEVPFYYVEYGIAQLGALQVWLNARQDYAQAVAMYRATLALGGSRPLPELFATAGLRFDFSEATLRPCIDAVMEEISRGG